MYIFPYIFAEFKKTTSLKQAAQQNKLYLEYQEVVYDICLTKWVKNRDCYDRFLGVYSFIAKTHEVTVHKLHLEKYPE